MYQGVALEKTSTDPKHPWSSLPSHLHIHTQKNPGSHAHLTDSHLFIYHLKTRHGSFSLGNILSVLVLQRWQSPAGARLHFSWSLYICLWLYLLHTSTTDDRGVPDHFTQVKCYFLDSSEQRNIFISLSPTTQRLRAKVRIISRLSLHATRIPDRHQSSYLPTPDLKDLALQLVRLHTKMLRSFSRSQLACQDNKIFWRALCFRFVFPFCFKPWTWP